MDVLLVILAAVFLAGLGFYLMHRIDRFAHHGGFHPYWDEAAQASAEDSPQSAAPDPTHIAR